MIKGGSLHLYCPATVPLDAYTWPYLYPFLCLFQLLVAIFLKIYNLLIMLKYTADIKALVYMGLTTLLFAFLWFGDYEMWSLLHIGLYGALLFFSVSVAVMTHNQMHTPMWKSKFLNRLTEYWLTCFYGAPVFAWIPTHNRNHHRHNNKPPDDTRTYRFSEKNNLFTVATYPSVSGSVQMLALRDYLKDRWKLNKSEFWYSVSQIVVLVAWYAFWLSVNWVFALLYVVVAHQFALYVVMLFNYVQHVHADEMSDYNHSRNFTGPWLNFLLFNNGLHTIHHMNASLHWSELRPAHNKIKDKIHPDLLEKTFLGYMFRAYLLAPIFPKYRTKSMRLARMNGKSSANAAPAAALQNSQSED